jgi:DNA-binding IclR family transcriptional regulator
MSQVKRLTRAIPSRYDAALRDKGGRASREWLFLERGRLGVPRPGSGDVVTNERTIAAVERAADVLSLFVDHEAVSLGVTEIAEQLDLSKAVVHRILTSFRGKGFIELDETTHRYSLGPTTLALGTTYLNHIDVRALVYPSLIALSGHTRETATLSIRTGFTHVFVEQVTPPDEVRMIVEPGKPSPLHAGSSGKAFLAFLDEETREGYLGQPALETLTPHTVTDPEVLRTQLAEIRSRGYAISFGERQRGSASIATPIFDHAGDPAAVVSLCGPGERFRESATTAATLLLERAAEMSRRLGHRSVEDPIAGSPSIG